ncbi:hypothetical protein BD779DRAFT_1479263 [Infundibulicybe gibba]|nr:hypothetical protein BD779DRAFT_1479263 [Infundibulicybe gibba]
MPVLAPGLSMGNLGHAPLRQSRSPSPLVSAVYALILEFAPLCCTQPYTDEFGETLLSVSPSAMPQWAVPEIPGSGDDGGFSTVSAQLVNESAMDKVGGVDAKAVTPIRDMPPIRDAPPLRRSTRPRSSRGSDVLGILPPGLARERLDTHLPKHPFVTSTGPTHECQLLSTSHRITSVAKNLARFTGSIIVIRGIDPPAQGDFFVHQVLNTDEVQLWLRRVSDTADVPPYWEPIVVGEHRSILDKTYTLSLNQAGQPIWVKPSTQEKREKLISSNNQAPSSSSSSSSDAASTSTLSDSSSIYGDYLDHE